MKKGGEGATAVAAKKKRRPIPVKRREPFDPAAVAADEVKTIPFRMLPRVNDKLREACTYRGDLSSIVTTVLQSVDLLVIELQEFPTGQAGAAAAEVDRPVVSTTIRLPQSLLDLLKSVAERRNTSRNALLNSAVLAALTTL